MATFDSEGQRRQAQALLPGPRDGGITTYWAVDIPGGNCGHRHRSYEAALRCARRTIGGLDAEIYVRRHQYGV